jgi:hypothetical protein
VPGFKGHLAHVGWPWYDECVAVMSVTTGVFGQDPAAWDLRRLMRNSGWPRSGGARNDAHRIEHFAGMVQLTL